MSHKTIILVLISLLSLGCVIYFVDIGEMVAALTQIDLWTLVISGGLIALNNLLSYFRFGALLKAFNVDPNRRAVFAAFSMGQISNQFLLNVFGQSLTRAMLLTRSGVPSGVSVIATYIERALAAGVLLLLSVVATWYLLHALILDFEGGTSLVVSLTSMVIVLLIVLTTVFRGTILRRIAEHGPAWARHLFPVVIFTLLAHLAMLAAYVVVLAQFDGGEFSLDLVAVLTITMFAASLPISFSGWGVRELSAVSALTLIDVPASTAVAGAVTVGLLSMVVMFAFGAISLPMIGKKRGAMCPMPAVGYPQGSTIKWDALLLKFFSFCCAVLIFFQLRIPLKSGELSVALADLPAVIGASIVALLIVMRRMKIPFQPFLISTLAIFSALIVYGLVAAYLQSGIGHWALVNRGVGWLVLLGYALTGAVIVSVAGEQGRALLLQSIIVAGLSVCGIQMAMLLTDSVVNLPPEILWLPLQGFVENQNAFSFQLMMVGLCLIVALARGSFAGKPFWFTAAFVLLTITIYYTKSRTGLVFIGCFAVGMYALSKLGVFFMVRDRLRITGALCIITVLLAMAFPYIVYGVIQAAHVIYGTVTGETAWAIVPFSHFNSVTALGFRLVHEASEVERLQTMREGLDIWRAHPIFGAGLGSYVDWRLSLDGKVQVIHSIPIWLLAEMGIVGLAIAIGASVYLLRIAVRMLRNEETFAWGLALIGLLAVMAIGGLVHDFFYQRIFWFLLGLFGAALPKKMSPVRSYGMSTQAANPALGASSIA